MAIQSTNIREFVKSVKTEIEIQGFKEFGIFKKKILRTALDRVVDRTPVDTGRLKANWVVGIDNIPSDVDVNRFDPGGEGSKAAGRAVIDSDANIFSNVFIVNNINYIEFIHDGTDRITANPFIAQVADELGLELIRQF